MRKAYALIGAAAGAMLIYDGFNGRRLWDDLLASIRGEPLPPTRTTPAALNIKGNVSNATQSIIGGVVKMMPGNPDNLVDITDIDGKPLGMKLIPEAAQAFQRAQKRVGRTIPLTSAWRDYASEVARNKQDPVRFPVPNYHTRGAGIDVWNNIGLPGWLQAPSVDPAVVSALQAEGWQRFDPDNRRGERMHWSYGGRG